MEGTTLEYLPILDSISFSTDYKEYEQEDYCELRQIVEARTFKIETPYDWELTEDFGQNVYAGRIENDTTTLFFEQGSRVFKSLSSIQESPGTIYFERFLIHGADALIHKEYCERSRSNVLTIYLEKENVQNKMYVFNTSNERMIINMFKSHIFY